MESDCAWKRAATNQYTPRDMSSRCRKPDLAVNARERRSVLYGLSKSRI